MQRVKAIGTIKIVLKRGKMKDKVAVCHDSDDGKSTGSLEPAYKALILNGHGQTHGTG
jgi:hypothetical protein